jgi:hypothetical protein
MGNASQLCTRNQSLERDFFDMDAGLVSKKMVAMHGIAQASSTVGVGRYLYIGRMRIENLPVKMKKNVSECLVRVFQPPLNPAN